MTKSKGKRKIEGDLSRSLLRGIFENYEIAADVLELLPKYLSERFGRGGGKGFGFFGIEKLRVQFTDEVDDVEIENIYNTNVATILAPVFQDESPCEQEERRKELLKFYVACMPDSQERATVQFYELLRATGREALLNELKKKYRKNEPSKN